MKSNLLKCLIVATLLAAIVIVVVAKNKKSHTAGITPAASSQIADNTDWGKGLDPNESRQASGQSGAKLPKLIDIGSTTCVPCKMMAGVLDQLSKECPGTLEVVFIDIKEREKASAYNIRAIPTQILYDQNGKEFFRHEGFLSKEDILKKFKEHGIDLPNS